MNEYVVPAQCPRGHELTARTTYVSPKGHGWHCVRCLRVDVFRAHYGRSVEIPADLLDAERFRRQPIDGQRESAVLSRVVFESGWGFDDPDPTPELRAERYGACGRGHLFTPENVYVAATGRRYCKVCRTLNQRRRRAGEPKLPDPRRALAPTDSSRIAVA